MVVRDSYFHRSYGYAGGGQGYGVGIGYHSGNILVENNIFQRLRHAMIVHAGCSGNVYGYNYSVDPVWDLSGIPCDISLHGHYPFMNLFEGNIVQKISNSDYWGPSGPGNTFFRNRVESNDIINMDNASNQNYVGNELLAGYDFDIVSGTGLIIHANNLNGTISYNPAYSTTLSNSLYLSSKPAFFGTTNWPSIGTPLTINTGTIPAKQRLIDMGGGPLPVRGFTTEPNTVNSESFFYPNPVQNILHLQLNKENNRLVVVDMSGKRVFDNNVPSNYKLDMNTFDTGVYFIRVENANGILNGKVMKK